MGTGTALDTGLVRNRLSRHPIAVEAARIAAALTRGRTEAVVFERGRAFVVAGSDAGTIMQPRSLLSAEQALLDGVSNLATTDGVIAVAIKASDGRLAGALTTWTSNDATPADVWHGLARQIGSVLTAGDRTRDFFESVVEGLRDTVLILAPDFTIRWVNEACSSLLGMTPSEAIGRSGSDLVHPDDLSTTLDAIARISQGLAITRVVVRLRDVTGAWVPAEVTGADHSHDPILGGLVLSLRFADYEGELGSSLERQRRMSGAVVSSLRDGIVATDEVGSVTLVNDVARSLFGIAPDVPAASLTLDDLELLDRNGRRRNLVEPSAPSLGTVPDDDESCVVTQRGEIRYVTSNTHLVVDDSGRTMGTVVAFHDITDERRAREELRSQALHDQLTGLANRRQLETRLDELARARPMSDVAVCFIDLDGFKLVNDNHGHRMGDQLIRIAARRLAGVLRETDLLVRQGGDEFVALLIGVADSEAATATAERCLHTLSEPYLIGTERFDLTASIGIALGDGDTAHDQLLQRADIALYAAKNRGRNRVEPFDETLAEAINLEERQRQILRDALENDRLVMHFQPLVDVASGETVGFEALARIRTESGELIGPASFMDAIANTGLMWDLDRAGFARSCEAVHLLSRIDPAKTPSMACNFSSVSLTHPHLLSTIEQIVQDAGVEPRQICIEITESAAFDAGPSATAVLVELHRRGFQLALDDFGTGYSSLAHLRDLPITSVKVDKSFIAKLGAHESERAIAEAVVTLARDLRLGVVAEGVETSDQLEHARQLGFATVQGWHYAPALSLADCLDTWSAQVGRHDGSDGHFGAEPDDVEREGDVTSANPG